MDISTPKLSLFLLLCCLIPLHSEAGDQRVEDQKKFHFQKGYQKGKILEVVLQNSLRLKCFLKAHKAVEENTIIQENTIQYEDKILSVKGPQRQEVERTYKKYERVRKALGKKNPVKEAHPLQGSRWKIQRRKKDRTNCTLLQGKGISRSAMNAVRLESSVAFLLAELPKKPVKVGYKWKLSQKAVNKFIGEGFKKVTQGEVTCTFQDVVEYQETRCAKFLIHLKVKGKHHFGANATMSLKGFFYFSLDQGIPRKLELKGNLKISIKQMAPRGQVVTFRGQGPVKKQYTARYVGSEEKK